MNEFDVKEFLTQSDNGFRELVEEHQGYEVQLQKLQEKPYLSEQEQWEETTIKKKKLALKDQMQFRIKQYLTEQSV